MSIFWGMVSCRNGTKSTSFTQANPTVVPERADSEMQVWPEETEASDLDFLSEEIDSTKYIFLDSDAKSTLGAIKHIFIDRGLITVADESITEKIVQFDMDGNYVRTIGSKGKAQGEYIGLEGVCKTGSGDFAVSDRLSGKLITYSKEGDFIGEHRFAGMMPQSMLITDSMMLGSYPGYQESSKFRLKWTDINNDEETATALPYTSPRKEVAGTIFEDPRRNVYFNHYLNDTIYRIKGTKIIPHILMNIHNRQATADFIEKTANLDEREYKKVLYNSDDIVNLVDLINCDRKWFAYYQKGMNTFVAIVSDEGKVRKNYNRSEVDHRSKNGKLFMPETFVDYLDGYLVGYIDPEAFSYLNTSLKKRYLKHIHEHSVNTLNDEDEIENYGNLILFMYKMK